MRRRTKILLSILGLSLVATLLPLKRVVGDEMSPSIRANDLIWVLPGAQILRGDVVALADPLDPSRTILRRAIAPGGTKIHFNDDGIRIDVKRIRIKDMGKLDGYGVYQETIWSKPPARSTDWLIRRHREPTVHWAAEPLEVPENHWYLLADDRDNALDSRWWGPVPTNALKGVVRLRYGTADTWRPQFERLLGSE